MANTICILSKPGIKCFPGNAKLYDIAQEKLDKVTGLTEVQGLVDV